MKKDRNKQKQQLYCKEKNLLQLPIFCFEKFDGKEKKICWKEEDGRKCQIICHTSRGIPGSLEQDVYAACMRLWVIQGMPDYGIVVQYSDIAQILNLDPIHWGTKIKNALLRLGDARYEFTECFINAKKKAFERIIQFSLFDTTEFQDARKKGGKWDKNKLYFPDEIKINLEQRYYQWLDFELYTSIKSGVPRRLYDFLEKRRYHNIEGTFSIGEQKLFRWIPLMDKNISSRRKTLKDAAQALIDAKYLADYEWERKSKVCSFAYGKALPRMAIDKNTIPKEPVKLTPVQDLQEIAKPEINLDLDGILSPEIAKKNLQQQEQKEKALREEQIKSLFGLLKKKTEALKEAITRYYDEHGHDYVLWNIRYANENAKKSYTTYLKKALAENWAYDWREEKQSQGEEAKKQIEEDGRKQEEKEQLRRAQELFKQRHEELPKKLKSKLWHQAESSVSPNNPGRETLVKFRYVEAVRQYLNSNGENFAKEVTSPMIFVKEIAVSTISASGVE